MKTVIVMVIINGVCFKTSLQLTIKIQELIGHLVSMNIKKWSEIQNSTIKQ